MLDLDTTIAPAASAVSELPQPLDSGPRRPLVLHVRRLRAVVRLLRVTLHLIRGLLTVALIHPLSSDATKVGLKKAWSARLLRILAIEHRVVGALPPAGLVVSNHISFTDVFAINAWMPSCFVAKDDVRRWPLIGWLVKNTDTLFLERGSRSAAQRAREEMVKHLRLGKRVFVFPEGTTSNGDQVSPFHSALFQAAIDANTTITPLAISYADGEGNRSHVADFVGDTTLLGCFWAIANADGITMTTTVLPALDGAAGDRRHLAARAHHVISQQLSRQLSPP